MSDIPPLRLNVQLEETQFRAAVSESTMQKLGGSVNFINDYQHDTKRFEINGRYPLLTTPFNAIDGLDIVLYDMEIIGAAMFVRQAGTGSTTELDLKYATTPGGSFTSIFSTTPKISYLAGDFSWCYVGSAFANTTAPVLSITDLAAGNAMRCDLIGSQSGDARGCGLIIFHRPRSA